MTGELPSPESKARCRRFLTLIQCFERRFETKPSRPMRQAARKRSGPISPGSNELMKMPAGLRASMRSRLALPRWSGGLRRSSPSMRLSPSHAQAPRQRHLAQPNSIHQCAERASPRSETSRNAYRTRPTSRATIHEGRVVLPSCPQSRSAPTSNPHSSLQASDQPRATSCLGAFWTPVS